MRVKVRVGVGIVTVRVGVIQVGVKVKVRRLGLGSVLNILVFCPCERGFIFGKASVVDPCGELYRRSRLFAFGVLFGLWVSERYQVNFK